MDNRTTTTDFRTLTFTADQLRSMLLHYWTKEPPKSLGGATLVLDQAIAQERIRQEME